MNTPMLADLRILAVEQYGAGPFGTLFLADLGAEVIKIENRADGGDVSRTVGPHFNEALPETAQSLFYQGLNRGKKSITLDLARPEGQAVFRRLAKHAQAVVSNLRGDVPEKLGITYGRLAEVNPGIVCAHLTGYGRQGSRTAWPGYDYLMQAEAGYFHLTGEPEAAPTRFGLSLVDLMTGVALATGLLAALRAAEREGRGRDVDVSLFDLALFNLNYIGHWYLNAGAATGRLPRSAHAALTPCQSYRTRGGWIYIMCNKEKFWGVLCRKIGRPEWIDDERFRSFRDRLKHRDLLTELIDEALQARTTDEWLKEFAGAVPAAPIYDVAQALENPYVKQSTRIESIPVPGGAPLRLLTNPLRGEGLPLAGRAAPTLGADTEAVLAQAGFSAEEVRALRDARIV
ncbi:MAG TPA: CoA transferase [Burkholderiales bacterium]|nr:CoA transferase [Burkholderiales bacterium]